MAQCQCAELFASTDEESIHDDYECAGSQLGERGKRGLKVVIGARLHDIELEAEAACCRLRVFDRGLHENWTCRVYQQGHRGPLGYDLVQQLLPSKPITIGGCCA